MNWSRTLEARKLIDQLLAEQPEFFVRRGGWIEGGGIRIYKGKTASALRRLYEREYERQLDLYQKGKDRNLILSELGLSADELIEKLDSWSFPVVGDPLLKRDAA